MILAEPFASYEVIDYRAAYNSMPAFAKHDVSEWANAFSFSKSDILKPGGNKAGITKRIESPFRSHGWEMERRLKFTSHKIDAMKSNVALEVEWSNKDTFYDRDLAAFDHLFAEGQIAVGVIITRSASLNVLFKSLESEGLSRTKYGASTTHTGKLISKLNKGGAGSCPVFVLGITPNQYRPEITFPDWLSFYEPD